MHDLTGHVTIADAELGAQVAGLVLDRSRREHPAAVALREQLLILALPALEQLHALARERDGERPLVATRSALSYCARAHAAVQTAYPDVPPSKDASSTSDVTAALNVQWPAGTRLNR